MEDQTVQFPGEQEGQPANVSPEVVEPDRGKNTGGLTEDDVRRLVQSERDRLEERLRKSLTEQLSAAPSTKAAPVNEDKPLPPAPAKVESGGVSQQVALVQRLQSDIDEEFGMKLLNSDPEAASVNRTGSEADYIKTYRNALKAKAARTKSDVKSEEPSAPQTRMPMIGTGGGAGTNPLTNINDPSTLLKIGLGGKP